MEKIFKKKEQKPKQEIKEEEPEVNPMEELAKETEADHSKLETETPEELEAPAQPGEQTRWVVGEVPTSTEKVLHDNETNKSYDLYSAIALILNKAYEE